MAFHMAVLGWVSVRVGMAYAKQVSSVSKSFNVLCLGGSRPGFGEMPNFYGMGRVSM